MTRYLLDSDAVVDYLKGFASTVTFISQLGADGHQFCTCDVIECETFSGTPLPQRPATEQLLDALEYLETSRQAARQAGMWRNTYRSRGIQLSTSDCLIAATAHQHGIPLITANPRDFPMPEVTILPLPRARV